MPRKGQTLLQGIVRCGLVWRFTAFALLWSAGRISRLSCVATTSASLEESTAKKCERMALDTQVEQRFLEALRPDQVALALAALAQLEQEEQAERKQWELRLERARYEAKRAERQYQAVEPENRLVARSLERQWEEKLRAVEAVEKEYQAWKSTSLWFAHPGGSRGHRGPWQ